jgi:23S rRNA (uracil1939-C5)-methyltransferase
LARALAASLPSIVEIELALDDAAMVRLLGWVAASSPIAAGPLFAGLERTAGGIDLLGARFAGLALASRVGSERAWRSDAGDVLQRITPTAGLTLRVPLGVFTQVNLVLNRRLVAEVLEATEAGPGRSIVDLYCGAGNFALPLAHAGARVHGVDVDVRAIGAAERSAEDLGLHGRARFVALSAERALLRADFPERIDVCVLDPPRAGAAAALGGVLARRPESIVYASCDAATFARDTRRILGAGYAFSSLRLLDLTPQTFRAEVVGVFRLTC